MADTVRKHYERLRKTDYTAWKQFNAALASEDLLTYFQRSIVRKGVNPSLLMIPSWIRTCMIRYMGFSNENFDTNTMPELADECQLAA